MRTRYPGPMTSLGLRWRARSALTVGLLLVVITGIGCLTKLDSTEEPTPADEHPATPELEIAPEGQSSERSVRKRLDPVADVETEIPAPRCGDGFVEIPRSRRLDSFCIQRTEVTVAHYRACVAAGACEPPGPPGDLPESRCNWGVGSRDDHPVNCVTWHDAVAFCRWIGGELPTVRQWTRAARGDDERRYPWNSSPPKSDTACWRRTEGTCPVGAFPDDTSPFGIVDLAGNVVEYTADAPETGWRSQRGGGWYHTSAEYLRISFPQAGGEEIRVINLGFRCVTR